MRVPPGCGKDRHPSSYPCHRSPPQAPWLTPMAHPRSERMRPSIARDKNHRTGGAERRAVGAGATRGGCDAPRARWPGSMVRSGLKSEAHRNRKAPQRPGAGGLVRRGLRAIVIDGVVRKGPARVSPGLTGPSARSTAWGGPRTAGGAGKEAGLGSSVSILLRATDRPLQAPPTPQLQEEAAGLPAAQRCAAPTSRRSAETHSAVWGCTGPAAASGCEGHGP